MLLPLVLVLQLCDVPVSSLSDTALSQGEGGQGQTAALWEGPLGTPTGHGGDFTDEGAKGGRS